MIRIKNNKNATILIAGKDVPPLGFIDLAEKEWKEEMAKRKPLRDAVAGGFVSASFIEIKTKKERR